MLLYRTCEWHRSNSHLKYLPNIAFVCIVLAVVMPVFYDAAAAAAAAAAAVVTLVIKPH